MLLVSVALSESVSTFVGFADNEAVLLERIQRLLWPSDVYVRLEELWNNARTEEERVQNTELDVDDDAVA